MIALLSNGSNVATEQANAVAQALDDALYALFAGRSPLLYLDLPTWRSSGLAGLLHVFGTQANRRILSGEASHDQAAFDNLAATAPFYSVPGTQFDHTKKQVTLDLSTNAFDFSLKVHRRVVNLTPAYGGTQEYWARTVYATDGVNTWYHHEHRHELAAIDVVFEGHASRVFEWPEEWNKFSCIRLHNLDPDEEDLEVTFRGSPDVTVTLPRWRCTTVRRNGETWESQGFVLWRARTSDVVRFGTTWPWNDRARAFGVPWQYLADADGANNVGSFAMVWRAIDFFSRGCPPEVLTSVAGGVVDAVEPRTGLWFDLAKVTNRAALAGMPDAQASGTKVWQLAAHGGSFFVAKAEVQTEPDELPLPPVVTSHTATLAELLAGGHDSQIALAVSGPGWNLTAAYEGAPGAPEPEFVDLIPIGANFAGSLSITLPTDGTPVDLPAPASPVPVLMQRLRQVLVTEAVIGLAVTATRTYSVIDFEDSWDGLPWDSFNQTVGDVEAWTFPGGGIGNTYCSFLVNETVWDGRRFAVRASVRCIPRGGVWGAGEARWNAVSRKIEASNAVWSQLWVVQEWPGVGGIWQIPERKRRAWTPPVPVPFSPHLNNLFGDGTDADWTAKPTTESPQSFVARLEGMPEAVRFGWGVAGFLATDSLVYLAANPPTPENWRGNRAAAMAGNVLPGETRPIIGAALLAVHYNAIAARLNALQEVVPFSFLDAQWYGRPFRPPTNREGVYGGHLYPTGFLCRAESGSVAASRAASLGITVKTLATEVPELAGLLNVEVRAREDMMGITEYQAHASANLINDLLVAFKPDLLPDNGSLELHQAGSPGAGWVQGAEYYSGQYWWRAPSESEAVVPSYHYATVGDVAAAADDLGIPFTFAALALPLRIKVILPERLGWGVRGSLAGAYTQAVLVVDSSAPQFVAYARRHADSALVWGGDGRVRVADWNPPVNDEGHSPNPVRAGSDDTEYMEVLGGPLCLNRGVAPGYAGDLSPAVQPFPLVIAAWGHSSLYGGWESWWRNGSLFEGEAPRVLKLVVGSAFDVPVGWTAPTIKAEVLASPAIQWGETELVSSPAPSVSPRWIDQASLAGVLTAGALFSAAGGQQWTGRGGFQVSLIPVGGSPDA